MATPEPTPAVLLDADEELVALAKHLGVRRLKALLLLWRHAELDDLSWSGKVELHFGGHSVKGAVHPASAEISP